MSSFSLASTSSPSLQSDIHDVPKRNSRARNGKKSRRLTTRNDFQRKGKQTRQSERQPAESTPDTSLSPSPQQKNVSGQMQSRFSPVQSLAQKTSSPTPIAAQDIENHERCTAAGPERDQPQTQCCSSTSRCVQLHNEVLFDEDVIDKLLQIGVEQMPQEVCGYPEHQYTILHLQAENEQLKQQLSVEKGRSAHHAGIVGQLQALASRILEGDDDRRSWDSRQQAFEVLMSSLTGQQNVVEDVDLRKTFNFKPAGRRKDIGKEEKFGPFTW